MPEHPPTIASLILEHGAKVNDHACTNCGRWSLFLLETDTPGETFTVCARCDATDDARRDAEAKARQHTE